VHLARGWFCSSGGGDGGIIDAESHPSPEMMATAMPPHHSLSIHTSCPSLSFL